MAETAVIVNSTADIPGSHFQADENTPHSELLAICRQQAESIEQLRITVANLSESVAYLTRKLYGRSREKLQISGQYSLFDEDTPAPESAAPALPPEEALAPEEDTAKKTRRRRSRRKDLFDGIETEKKVIRIPEGERSCPICGKEMSVLGTEMVREELIIKPIEIKRIQYYRETLVCSTCKDEYGSFAYKSPEVPPALIRHSMASASAVTYIINQKFVNYVTFYRIEQELKSRGAPVGREIMAKWIIICALSILKPLYDLLFTKQKLRKVLHGDETWCQVLHEKGRDPTSKSYIWLIVTGNDGLPAIVTYHYAPTRAHTVPEELLGDFCGYFHTDKYDGYNCLGHIIRCLCWAHGRRKWFEAISPSFKNRDRGQLKIEDLTPAEIGFLYCDKLFEKERRLKDLPPEERKEKRIETEKPLLNSFWAWLDTVKPLQGSRLEKAVNYFKDSRKEFENFLLDGRCSISNNLAENSARPYVVSRKNFLFHNSVDGAKASSIIFSIVLTAKANNIDISKYMEILLQKMPDYKNEPEGIENLLPWSDYIQSTCRKTEIVRSSPSG